MKPSSTRSDWAWVGALFLLTFLAYLPVLRGSFIWDDSVMVQDNQMLRSARGLRDFWFTTRAVDPLPATMTALWLQWQCWGANTLGYHVVSVLAHILGALLFWRVLLRFTKSTRLAWLAAAIFALHPVCVGSVGWISEQKNTLSIVFYFLAILGYFRFADAKPADAKRWICYGLALLLFLLALFCKGSVVMLPMVLALILWWQRRKIVARDLLKLVPFFLLSIAASLGTIWIQNHKAIGGAMVQELGWPARIASAALAVWFYAWKDLIPLRLCVIYPGWQVNAASIAPWLPLAALLGIFALAWCCRETWGRHVVLGLGCFVVTLFPVMGFFNMYFLVYSRVADHWQYLALPALIGLVVCGLGENFQRAAAKLQFPKFTGSAIAAILVLLFFAATWTRAGVYKNERTLWTDTVKKNPSAWMAWNNLGNALAADGENDAALDAYQKALDVNPNFPDAHSNLGNALVAKGRLDDALVDLKEAVEEEPRMAKFHFNYGVGLAAEGKKDEAIAEYEKALKLRPHMADVRNNLASIYCQQNKFADALEEAELAIQIDPNLAPPQLNAAKALAGLGHTGEAASRFEKFLQMRPDDAGGHFEYGMLLAMHGHLDKALPEFQAVVRLKPGDAASHGSLGNTLAGLKRLDEAIAEFQIGEQLAPNDPQNENNLATALLEKGDLTQAIAHYEMSIKLNGNDAGTRVNYAQALLQRGRRDDAIAQYREALRLKPGDAAIQQRLTAALRQ